jgi:hypothetical protein
MICPSRVKPKQKLSEGRYERITVTSLPNQRVEECSVSRRGVEIKQGSLTACATDFSTLWSIHRVVRGTHTGAPALWKSAASARR